MNIGCIREYKTETTVNQTHVKRGISFRQVFENQNGT